jgi:hypothetical protein
LPTISDTFSFVCWHGRNSNIKDPRPTAPQPCWC